MLNIMVNNYKQSWSYVGRTAKGIRNYDIYPMGNLPTWNWHQK